MTRKMMVICDRTEGIYAERFYNLLRKRYPRHKYMFYAVRTSNGLRYHFEINLSCEEYQNICNIVAGRKKYYLGVDSSATEYIIK